MKKILAIIFLLLMTVSVADAIVLLAPAGKTWVGPDKNGKARSIYAHPTGDAVTVYCDDTVTGQCVTNHGTHLTIDVDYDEGGVPILYTAQ